MDAAGFDPARASPPELLLDHTVGSVLPGVDQQHPREPGPKALCSRAPPKGAMNRTDPGSEGRPRVDHPLWSSLRRNVLIALLLAVGIAVLGRRASLVLPGFLLALWPSLGGHFLETAFLAGVRPRLPRAFLVQTMARLGWWL